MDGAWVKETLKGVAAWCVYSSGSLCGRELQDDAAITCVFVDSSTKLEAIAGCKLLDGEGQKGSGMLRFAPIVWN